MKTTEFNKLIKKEIKSILEGDAQNLFDTLNCLNLYRYGGIESESFNTILREIAIANILGIEFADNINLDDEIKNFNL
jgi:hypothetical protein